MGLAPADMSRALSIVNSVYPCFACDNCTAMWFLAARRMYDPRTRKGENERCASLLSPCLDNFARQAKLNEYEFPIKKVANVQSQLSRLIEKNYYLNKSAREVGLVLCRLVGWEVTLSGVRAKFSTFSGHRICWKTVLGALGD